MRVLSRGLAALLIACGGCAGGASAQLYPARPVRLVVPFAPGSTTDSLARLIANRITEPLGQQVVVDNRPGAGGNIGTEIVARATADGHTLLMAAGSHAINPSLYRKLPFDAVKDFAPITLVGEAPLVLVAYPQLSASSMPELIALAKSKPGQLSYASGGSGSPSHLAMELLKSMAGIELTHVPYKGGAPVLTALLSGEVQVTAGGMLALLPQIRAKKLKALAVTSAKRSPVAPEIPTVAESGVARYQVTGWWGLLAPAGTPSSVVARLEREVASQLQSRELRERLSSEGIEAIGSSPQHFAAYLNEDIAKWAKVVKLSGARAE